MNELELKKAFEAKTPLLNAWGEYVKNNIVSELMKKEIDPSLFLKVPATHRVKTIDSFIDKALYRKKNYSNPLADITDQVGVRFITLLYQDVSLIREIIENFDGWLFSLERNYESEGLEQPYYFDYQSVHYLVWTEEPLLINGIEICNIKCEIQVRTLLQHAYAELTHDLIYKPEVMVPPEIKRVVGRSMALIETTDIMFEETAKTVRKEIAFMNQAICELVDVCNDFKLPITNNKHLNASLFYNIENLLCDDILYKFKQAITFADNPIITATKHLMSNYDELIFKQPIIPLVLYLIQNKSATLYEKWDFDNRYLEIMYSQIGITPPYTN